MNPVLASELNERRAGIMFSEDRDDLRLGEARLAHMSFLFRPLGRGTHGINWPGLSGRRHLRYDTHLIAIANYSNRQLRDELLNEQAFPTIFHARSMIEEGGSWQLPRRRNRPP